MDRIIVGFDGSQAARAALTWAVAEARWHDATLAVWTILDDQGLPADSPPDGAQTLQSIKSMVDELTNGSPAEHRIGHGHAAAELIGACTIADLLVVGSRGHNPVASLLLGSVSRSCLHAAPCAVVIVRPQPVPAPPHRRVIVGIDASPQSRHALAVAAEEARLRRAALHAVHAVHWDRTGFGLVAPDNQQLVAWGKHLVDTELAHAGVTARAVIIPGHPADVLVRHSTHADLLVLGSRGHSPLANLFLGSTSDHCAHYAHCPVLIVRSGP